MTDKLPPNLLALFAPRPPLRFLPPSDQPPEERRTAKIDGVAEYMDELRKKAANAKATEAGQIGETDPRYEPPPTESWLEQHDRKKFEKAQAQKDLVTEGWRELYQPDIQYTADVKGNPFTTLFIARLSYAADESDLRREFGRYGRISQVRIIRDGGQGKTEKAAKNKGKSRGYAFVVYEREDDMKGLLSRVVRESATDF